MEKKQSSVESKCIFEARTDTTSATICKHCGKEKFLHVSEIVWDFMGNTIPQPPIELTKMSNKNKTSIDLFAISLYEKGFLKGNGDDINDLLKEHKAMHKEEIKDAVNSCGYQDEAEYYYNETFGGEE